MEKLNEKDFLEFLKKKNLFEFQSKALAEFLKRQYLIPKNQTLKMIKLLKEKRIIKRVSKSGYCQTTCESCYEYGCDAGPQTPINYWKIVKL